jgi:hypothetical protein
MIRISNVAGWRRAAKTRVRVLTTITEQLAGGKQQISVLVTPRDVGNHMGVGISRLCSEIEAAGFRVIRSSNPGYLRRAEIVIMPARSALKQHRIVQQATRPDPSGAFTSPRRRSRYQTS